MLTTSCICFPLTGSFRKGYTSVQKDTVVWLSMYPDETGYVYISLNALPIEMQTEDGRKGYQPVCQVNVGVDAYTKTKILIVSNLTGTLPIANFIKQNLPKYCSIEQLISGHFLPENAMQAAANVAFQEYQVQQKMVQALLAAGFDSQSIANTLKLKQSDIDSAVPTANLPDSVDTTGETRPAVLSANQLQQLYPKGLRQFKENFKEFTGNSWNQAADYYNNLQ